MIYNNLQLDIIREFGSKELTEGCLIFMKEKNEFHVLDICDTIEEWVIAREYPWSLSYNIITKDFEILWHIPNLSPDVFRVAEEKQVYISFDNRDYHSLVYHPSHE